MQLATIIDATPFRDIQQALFPQAKATSGDGCFALGPIGSALETIEPIDPAGGLPGPRIDGVEDARFNRLHVEITRGLDAGVPQRALGIFERSESMPEAVRIAILVF